jgi:hypothetical protein
VCENVACRNGCRSETKVAEYVCNGQKVTGESMKDVLYASHSPQIAGVVN